MNSHRAIFTSGLRTPFARAVSGAYKEIRPDDLLIKLLSANREKYPLLWESGAPDDVIVGCAYPEGEQGYNIARMSALGLSLPISGITVNRLCASSLDAAIIAASHISAGYGTKYLVCGIESMSRIPRRGANFSESNLIKERAPKAYITMGETAEEVAKKYPEITHTMQEDYAERSHELSFKAYDNGYYREEIAQNFSIEMDEGIRYPVNREKMKSLPPAFTKDGVVTAATSSPLSDGATSGWVLAESEANRLNIKDGLIIEDFCVSHVEPGLMGLGPIPAVKKLLSKNNLHPNDIGAIEMNEAFAIQVLACIKELNLDISRINCWGGALAIGHPLGASGLRLLITLLGRLRQIGENYKLGIATLCVGGGQGVAVLGKYKKF